MLDIRMVRQLLAPIGSPKYVQAKFAHSRRSCNNVNNPFQDGLRYREFMVKEH